MSYHGRAEASLALAVAFVPLIAFGRVCVDIGFLSGVLVQGEAGGY